MTIELVDLAEDIISSNIASHLSPQDIFSLSLTSRQFHEYLTTNDVYKLLYYKKFGSTKPTPLNLNDYNWRELFYVRASPKVNLYTWGSSTSGRLGYLLGDIPDENKTSGGFVKNVHTPTNVVNFNDLIISDISAGGFSFQILMNDGDLFHTGSNWTSSDRSFLTPGPHHAKDYYERIRTYASSTVPITPLPFIESMASRRMIRRPPHTTMVEGEQQSEQEGHHTNNSIPVTRETNSNLTLPPEQQGLVPGLNQTSTSSSSTPDIGIELPLEKEKTQHTVIESNFITKLQLPPDTPLDNKIISVSSGRQHFIAIDNQSNIYTWDTGNVNKIGVRLKFPTLKFSLNNHYIKKISAGWNLSAFHSNKYGIVVWFGRNAISKENFNNNIIESDAKYVIIPNTVKIIDFIALHDFILYIDKEGKLNRFDLWAEGYAKEEIEIGSIEDSFEVSKFNKWLQKNNDMTGSKAIFTKLSGCYKNFSVFSNYGNVLLGNKENTERVANGVEEGEEGEEQYEPIMIEELQNQHIIHVVMGDYHFMALTDKGELMSWGMESSECGCLGLGCKEQFIRSHINTHLPIEDLGRQKGMRVGRPSIVKTPTPTPSEEGGSEVRGKWLTIAAAGWHSAGLYRAS